MQTNVFQYHCFVLLLDWNIVNMSCYHSFVILFCCSLDVIGVLQDVMRIQMAGGGKKSCANITLRDKAGNFIKVTLWEDCEKQFMNYNNSNSNIGLTIIILAHAWCNKNTCLSHYINRLSR